ncbi:class I SAM-dependent methyltransferase [Gordonia zhaorongruii]|uniref:class I SAM-dependent methyltransferase n=1 Tax=Gordonia zhaorongruii TaxID=2597659 RepID=UPI001F436C58|nr:class I SAM-dependent methyltransferase [Gordonia zhaorongruii]
MSVQPGYDALAPMYAELFTGPFESPLERAAVDAFVHGVLPVGTTVVDVGSGIGHVTAHLSSAGLSVIGVEPSKGMRSIAQRMHPDLVFHDDDAHLRTVDLSAASGIIARYSLIHVKPDDVREVLAGWASRLPTGAVVLLAGQSADEPGVHEFDHAVARAWRWHPNAIGDALRDAGFIEDWRTISRPDEKHRFPEFHVCAVR